MFPSLLSIMQCDAPGGIISLLEEGSDSVLTAASSLPKLVFQLIESYNQGDTEQAI